MSYRVFLSHSGPDRRWAEWIDGRAKQVGIEVYLFEHDPRPGVQLAEKIQVAIRESDALVVLLTPHGASSAYVQQEIGCAINSRRLVIPFVWPQVQERSLAMLQGMEWVAFNPSNPEEALVQTLKYLETLKAKKESAQAVLAIGALIVTAFALSAKG